MVESWGEASYSTNDSESYKRAAVFVDKMPSPPIYP